MRTLPRCPPPVHGGRIMYRTHTTTFLSLKNNLSTLIRRLERNLNHPANSKINGETIENGLHALLPESQAVSIAGIVATLLQNNYLIPSKGTASLLQTLSPTSSRIRYRIQSKGLETSNKYILSCASSASSASSANTATFSSSTSNTSSSGRVNAASATNIPTAIPVITGTRRNLSAELNQVADRQSEHVSLLSILVVYAAGALFLFLARENFIVHTAGLIVVGIVALASWSLHPTQQPQPTAPPSTTATMGTATAIATTTTTTTAATTSFTPSIASIPSSSTLSPSTKPRGVPVSSKAPYVYYGSHQDEFSNCIQVIEETLKEEYADWKCTTANMGLDKFYGAFGTIHRTTPKGHKYSKFKLVLHIPQECGSIRDVVRCCTQERLKWDESILKIEVLKQHSKDSCCTLRTMLYTTAKTFGISQRAFVDRQWNLEFQDGSVLSMSNSVPFIEPVPNDVLASLDTPHTRGVNYPGSAWMFDTCRRSGKEYTKMTMLIHSDLKGWMYSGVVNASLNSHLNQFSKVLLQYICDQKKKKKA